MPLQADRHRPAAAVLAAADTRKNRCHARLYPNGTPPLGSRSSRYQEEPMPRTLSRSLGDRVHARSSRYQEEPMPPVTGRLSPRGNQALSQQPIPGRTDATPAPTLPTRSARPLAAADTRKNRCHCCTDYPILCRPDSQQPIPARTDATAHVGRYDALRATSQQPIPGRTDATDRSAVGTFEGGELAAADTRKNRCHSPSGSLPGASGGPRSSLHQSNRCHFAAHRRAFVSKWIPREQPPVEAGDLPRIHGNPHHAERPSDHSLAST